MAIRPRKAPSPKKAPPPSADGANLKNASGAQRYIERIERLEGQKSEISEDIKEIKKEAAQDGYTTRSLNDVLRDRKKMAKLGEQEYEAYQDEIDTLKEELGDFLTLPLGRAALDAAEGAATLQ